MDTYSVHFFFGYEIPRVVKMRAVSRQCLVTLMMIAINRHMKITASVVLLFGK